MKKERSTRHVHAGCLVRSLVTCLQIGVRETAGTSRFSQKHHGHTTHTHVPLMHWSVVGLHSFPQLPQ